MNAAIAPLLWKESRDLRPWLYGAPAAALLLVILNLNHFFERGFQSIYYATMPLLTFCLAIALGAGQIARERHARTLDFLLVRPVSPATILWTKFLAGTVTLAILAALAAGLCYLDPKYQDDSGLLGLRQAAGYTQLLATLLPRLWCAYSLALLFSVMMTRTANAVGATGFTIMGLGCLAGFYAELYPFAPVDPWLSFFNAPTLMLWMNSDPNLLRPLDLAATVAAPLLALFAAMLFLRRPARTLRNRTLVIGGVALAGLALLSAKVDANRLPILAPAGRLDLRCIHSKHEPQCMDANGPVVALAMPDSLAWLDFHDLAHPRKLVEAPMPLWTTKKLIVSDNDAYLFGTKKALPVDEIQVVVAHLASDTSVQFGTPLLLGAEDAIDFAQSMAVRGNYLFVDVIRQRECRIEVYDLGSGNGGQQVAAVKVDEVRPAPPGTPENRVPKGAMRITLRGNYLYVASPSALTTLDVTNPAQPVVSSRTGYREPIPLFYTWERPLATDGKWLVETQMLPFIAGLYDLTDPAHPAFRGRQPSKGMSILETGGLLYESWRRGVLEFRVSDGRFSASRYLTDGHPGGWMLTASEGRLYQFRQDEDGQFLLAYQVR